MGREISVMREHVRREQNWGCEGGQVAAGGLDPGSKIGKQILGLDRPVAPATNLEFHAAATGPTGQLARDRGAFMGGCEGVDEIFRIVEIGQSYAAGSIYHDPTACNANAGTRCKKVIGLDRLGNGEIGGRTARISCRGRKVVLDVHAAKISLDAKDPMTLLEVIADLTAAIEAAGTQGLVTCCGYRRNAALGEKACWAKNGAGKRITVTFDAAAVPTDVEAIKILSLRRAGSKQSEH